MSVGLKARQSGRFAFLVNLFCCYSHVFVEMKSGCEEIDYTVHMLHTAIIIAAVVLRIPKGCSVNITCSVPTTAQQLIRQHYVLYSYTVNGFVGFHSAVG
jgi:hypothetical protein